MMKVLIETITGRKGYKSFKTLNEYVEFMTNNSAKIKSIMEADMPYDDKPVDLPKISSSEGWEQVDKSAFNKIDSSAEKGDCLIPQNGQTVFKNDVKFESSKTSEKADTNEQPKVEQSPVKTSQNGDSKEFKEFSYEEDKKTDNKEENESNNKDEKKSEEKSEKKEDLKESSVGIDSNSRYVIEWDKSEGFRVVDKSKGKTIYSSPNRENALRYFKRKAKEEGLTESISDYLPKAGFMRDEAGNKEGAYVGQGTKDQMKMAQIIARVKYANGQRMGRVTKEDLDNFDEYYHEYQELFGEQLDEDFRSGLKKAGKFAKGALAGAAMAGSLASGANAMDNPNMYYDGARNPYIDSYNDDNKIMINGQEYSLDELKKLQKEQGLSDEEMKEIIKGNNPYEDGARNPMTESIEDEDNMDENRTAISEYISDRYPELQFSDNGVDLDGKDIEIYSIYDGDDARLMKTIADDLTSQFGSIASFEPLDNDSIRILYNKDSFDDEINEVLKQAGVRLDEDESCSEQSHDEEDGEIDPKTGNKKLFEEDPLDETMSDEEYDSLKDGDVVNSDYSKFSPNFTVKKVDGNTVSLYGMEGQGNLIGKNNKESIKNYYSKGYKKPLSKDSVEYAEAQVMIWKDEVMRAEYDDFGYTNGTMDDAERNLSYWKKELERRKAQQSSLNESNDEQLEEEISPSRLWKYQEHPEMNFAILSADRSERTPEENKAKTEELKKDIKSMGYWYTELKGGYVEIGENGKRVPVDGEDSFIVPNMTKEEAMELGKKYDQDTVMFKDAKAHTLQYIITNERAGNVGDADSSFETQAGKDNFSVSSGDDLDYYSRLPKSNKKDLKIGFNWKG
nr:MAG TPA: Protein of unknown function (DUF3293) [Caudoviricetes sp.]